LAWRKGCACVLRCRWDGLGDRRPFFALSGLAGGAQGEYNRKDR
jgi:hypothetical protein